VAGVLDGIRVLDFTRVFAGPAAGQMLGDLGADVVKIEQPGRGDEARTLGAKPAPDGAPAKVSASFLAFNRNKRGLAIDLGRAEGRETVRRMALASDVLLHNFRPGAMERWGLGAEELRAAQPRLVYCAFSAYGARGPLAHIGANDLALQAHSGLLGITGEPGRPPVRVGSAAIDLHGGLAMVAGILAALLQREKSGEGQTVESSLLASSADLMGYFYVDYWRDGTVHRPMGTANHLSVPNQAFPTADGSVVIIAAAAEMWRRCAEALDPVRLDRPEFRTGADRRKNREALVAALSEVTGAMTADEVVRRLGAVQVNVAKVNSIAEAAEHPQLEAAGGIVGFDYEGRRMKAVAAPFSLSETPLTVRRPPPGLGADADAVLADFGFSAAEIAALRRAGAFGPA
jgi:crotonobetainyl-CoA:carnitine CoA-transferase CaiB-like acyl-CoA transferase